VAAMTSPEVEKVLLAYINPLFCGEQVCREHSKSKKCKFDARCWAKVPF
jgi:hypothetical protein